MNLEISPEDIDCTHGIGVPSKGNSTLKQARNTFGYSRQQMKR